MNDFQESKSEKKYITIFENLSSPVIILDNQYQIENINRAAGDLFNIEWVSKDRPSREKEEQILCWVKDELKLFEAGNTREVTFVKKLETDNYDRYYEVNLKQMLDNNENVSGMVMLLNDITEHIDTQRAVKQVNEELNQIFNTAADGMRVIDKDFNMLRVNDTFASLTGISKEIAIGKKCYEIFPGPQCHTPGCPLIRIFSGEEKVEYDTEKVRVDGGNIPCIVSSAPFRSPDGEFIGIVEDFKDITERKKSEAALFREKEQLAVTLSSIGDGVIVVDTGSKITMMNPIAETLSGWTQDEAIDRHLDEIFQIINEFDRKPVENPVKKVFNEGRIIELADNTVLVARNGIERSISDSAAPIKDKEGNILGAILVFRDVTEERKREQALIESEERFRLLAENARDIIFRKRLSPEVKFEYISPSVEHITGFAPEEFYAEPGIDLKCINPEDRGLLTPAGADEIDYTEPVILRFNCKDGSTIWVEQRTAPIYDEKGELVVLEGIVRDITERKQLEEKLRYLGTHDSLTGLYNRGYFDYRMKHLGKECDALGIIVCDVDELKSVNDTFGHDNGDQIIKAAAGVIREPLRESDIVARIGGDEFAVLLPNTTEAGTRMACNRIKESIQKHNKYNPKQKLNISIGFASSNCSNTSLKALFKKADMNMYRVKTQKKYAGDR